MKLFLIILTIITILGCNPKTASFDTNNTSLEPQLIKDYPEKGWISFPTARLYDDPGTIKGIMASGAEYLVFDTVVDSSKWKDVDLACTSKERQVFAGGKFIFKLGFNSGNWNPEIGAYFSNNFKVSICCDSAQTYNLKIGDIERTILSNVKLRSKSVFVFDRYYAIASVTRSKVLKFKFDKKTASEISLFLNSNKIPLTQDGKATLDTSEIKLGFSWNENREYQLWRNFGGYRNVFYQPMPFDPDSIIPRSELIADNNRVNTHEIIFDTIRCPEVRRPETMYTKYQFRGGDTIILDAGGCVQTGGSGKTWKDYVYPSPPELYYGSIRIPGILDSITRLSDIISHPIIIPKSEKSFILYYGYKDDVYDDNGYWSPDVGTNNQCAGKSDAYIAITIKRN